MNAHEDPITAIRWQNAPIYLKGFRVPARAAFMVMGFSVQVQ